MKVKSYSSKITSIWCALCTNCLVVIYCSVHLSFLVLSTYHLLYCPLIPRAPSLVLPGDWIYPQITRELVPRHYQIEDISDNQLVLNIYITFTTMIVNDLNSQHITNHQLGFKLFTVHSSPAQRLPILNQYIKTNLTVQILN